MKSLSKILITLLTIIFTGTCSHLYAQNIDNNRMTRDINIMENVLEEMFKTDVRSSANRVRATGFSYRGNNHIRGTYLPNYGIIFSIPGMQRSFISLNSEGEDEDGYAYVFEYSDSPGNKDEVTKEAIVLRIKEFLREYGSTIGQLQDDEKIMVIYNSTNQNNAFTVFSSSGSGLKRVTDKLPTISVVIKKNDLNEYRSGNISKHELDKLFSVSTVEEKNNNQLDLKVMANIFETALKSSDKESFRISGDVDYLNLDNFGAIFSMKVNYGNSIHLAGAYTVRALNTVRLDFLENAKDSVVVAEAKERAKQAKQKQEEREQAEKESYRSFLTNVKEYLVDYGRTLGSVSSNQHVLISATISSRVDEIPERVDFQVKKSVLEAIDDGSMSRDQAINQISVREY